MYQQVQGYGDSPAGGADHCMPNSIGSKGRPWHPEPMKGSEVGTPAVPRRNHCKRMWD